MKNPESYKVNPPKNYVFETTPERSQHMSKIRGKNTTPEILLRKGLTKEGLRYRLNVTKLPGSPDVVLGKYKLAIFVDGEFWHGYDWEIKKRKIKANKDYWIAKIERNIQRDAQNNSDLCELGYTVMRFWEKDLKKDLASCILRVKTHIQNFS